MRKITGAALVVLLIAFGLTAQSPAPAPRRATPEDLAAIQKYIHETWHTLTRSNAQLALAAVDPKFSPGPGGRWPVYISQTEDLATIKQRLHQRMLDDDVVKIEIRTLPEHVIQPGLLYLPQAYVVPGGRFNEMYGWDSYFIQVGLLRDGENALAKDMVDNFLYEIYEHH
jgi:alpha,alpha-trehalase